MNYYLVHVVIRNSSVDYHGIITQGSSLRLLNRSGLGMVLVIVETAIPAGRRSSFDSPGRDFGP